jgi:hypothetical protein
VVIYDDYLTNFAQESLVLMYSLCKNNPAIQKIMVFENAFENLFQIIEEEKLSYGGVLAADSLMVIEGLIDKNTSNKVRSMIKLMI